MSRRFKLPFNQISARFTQERAALIANPTEVSKMLYKEFVKESSPIESSSLDGLITNYSPLILTVIVTAQSFGFNHPVAVALLSAFDDLAQENFNVRLVGFHEEDFGKAQAQLIRSWATDPFRVAPVLP